MGDAMHEDWTDKLSDYLDDELPADERSALDRHLLDCPSCAAVLNDLKRVVARAHSLESAPPQSDLWPAIAGATRRRHVAGWLLWLWEWRALRVTFSMPQAVTASLAIAALSFAVAWAVASRWAGRPAPAQVAASQTAAPEGDIGVVTTAMNWSFADAQYDAAVADLEKALDRGRGRLDGSTVAIVEHNLQIIDHAIDQARQALEADPANEYLSSHLVETRRRKLDLLRRATALTEMD